ncbi:MAG: preprotein translocase subunit SecA [bacterium]
MAALKADWQVRHDAVLKAGGLHIIGTERHESRRIDNQLRGRSGRQGDDGSTRFYLSLEDSLMRIFASDRVSNLMQKLGMEEGEAIEHPWVTKAIENAQRKVEGHNFDMRKNLLEYDDVANDQRKVVYEQRAELMETEDMRDIIDELREEIIPGVINQYIPAGSLEEAWDLDGLKSELQTVTNREFEVAAWLAESPNLPEEDITTRILQDLTEDYDQKEQTAGTEGLRNFERYVALQALDESWKEHLAGMDYLRQSVGLRGYAQKNPKQEYKREAFELFTTMLGEYKAQVVSVLSKVQVRSADQVEEAQAQAEAQAARQQVTEVSYEHKEVASALANEPQSGAGAGADAAIAAAASERVGARQQAQSTANTQPVRRDMPKVGRNEPCPCGSGKKYKACHGKLS